MLTFTQGRDSAVSIKPRHITLLSLMMRLTRVERDAIRAAEVTDGDVSDIMFLFSKAQFIDLDRPETIQSIEVLETKLLLGVGRASIVLNTDVADIERP